MPSPLLPPALPPAAAAAAAAPRTPEEDASTLDAVRALLAEERAHAARRPAPSAAEWRFLLVLYESALAGRPLTAAEAAEAAAVPPACAPAIAADLAAQHVLDPAADGAPLRLTADAREHLAGWIDALTPLPAAGPCGVTPSRAAEAAPRRAPRPAPRASRW